MNLGVICAGQRHYIRFPFSLMLCRIVPQSKTVFLFKSVGLSIRLPTNGRSPQSFVLREAQCGLKNLLTNCIPLFVDTGVGVPYCIIQLSWKRDAVCNAVVFGVLKALFTFERRRISTSTYFCRLWCSEMVRRCPSWQITVEHLRETNVWASGFIQRLALVTLVARIYSRVQAVRHVHVAGYSHHTFVHSPFTQMSRWCWIMRVI